MGINEYIGSILTKSDESLVDAIVEGDTRTIRHLASNKYATRIINKGCRDEPLSITKMIDALESMLNKKNINVRMC